MTTRPLHPSNAASSPTHGESPERTHFAYKSVAGYLVAFCLSLLIGGVSVYAQRSVVVGKDQVEAIYAGELVEVGRLRSAAGQKVLGGRGYLLTGNPVYLEERDAARREFLASLEALAARAVDPSERALVERLARAQQAYRAATEQSIALEREGRDRQEVVQYFERVARPRLDELEAAIDALATSVDERLEGARLRAAQAASRAARLVLVVAGASMTLSAGLGLLFMRTMRRLRHASEERQAALAREKQARREAEAARSELALSVQRLEEVNADLDAFAGRIAHDLRGVLTPIALCPALLRKARDEEAIATVASSIKRSCARAHSMLEGLLAFSRAGKPAEGTHAASVSEVITAVVEDLSPLAAEAQAEVSVERVDARVACAPELLHVVLLNLVSNALKYIGKGERREVRIGGRREGEGARISVEDTGPGIPKEALDRIFEPFFRVPGVRAPGAGIGLATVRRIVLAYGGRLECSSEPGRGARFDVWLPCASDATSALSSSAAAPQ
ncbi:sensor histidine kinase [Polyangium aurulentum]|uniref:sensor histidine kinase n=1 Tax=Polyangium aurulentum TaxID=2567896 RepID=UPI00146B4C7E|nr:ATP-binding protein [Polyangium aurulentum]UQA56853.1 CHASE3 domain-containing protein [Polyangium aurulentum]